MILNKPLYFLLLLITSITAYSQGSSCANIQPFCSDIGINFANTTGVASAEAGPSYGCLTTTPNPSWFYIKIANSGDLNLRIEQNAAFDFTGAGLDVDFVSWGPFTEAEITAGVCNNLTNVNRVACSYSPDVIENFNLIGVVSGQYYIVMVTNYNGGPGFIKMNLVSSSTGSTDCSIVSDVKYCAGDSMTFDATQGGAVRYEWKEGATVLAETGPVLSGIVAVNDVTYTADSYNASDNLIFTREFNVIVSSVPVATQPLDVILCDDDNDGIMDFDLSSRESDILNGQSTTDFEVVYFSDPTYTTQITGGDITSFTSTGQTIYARVLNRNNVNCSADTSFDLKVFDSPFPAANISPLKECDNTSVGTDIDGFILFDLTQKETEILNGQAAADFTLSYFTDAAYTSPIATPSNAFQNTAVGGQTIYVQVANTLNNTCVANTSFEIKVLELPTLLTTTITLIQCNDDLTLVEPFNLRLKEDEISADHTNEVFTYYESSADAAAGVTGTEITNPLTYQNQVADFDTVWVRVENSDGCYRVAQVNLDVVPSSAVINGFIRHFYQCDDGADTRDGFATFNFSSVTNDIKALFTPLTIDVLYYETENEANQGLVADQLDPTNYDNISQDQLIWVQIVSDSGSDCLAKGQYVQLHVESLPVANIPTTAMKQCDDSYDGIFPFDTSMIRDEILKGQSLSDVTITYFNEDGSPVAGVVNSALPNPFGTNSQTITIVVTNNVTNDPDGTCSDSTTLTFTVDALPRNEVQSIAAMCEDDPDDGMLIATFDTSNLEASINAQAGMDITYLDANGNPLKDSDGNFIISPFPNSFVTQTQTITVVVTNPQNTSCPQSKTVDFIVNSRPVFDIAKEDVVCQNLLPKRIAADNAQGNYTYQWFNSTGDLLMSGATLNLDAINSVDITRNGVEYSVVATDVVTNCTGVRKFVLKKSSIATLTDEDVVTIEFNSPDNSITIDTSNLGEGDYEFALDHASDSRSFQDDPTFSNLLGGVYTLLINDKNGCGQISKQVFLLDYPKFFTPNNDGQNDVWKLTGVDSSSFTASPIQIYDRFGKVVAIINPTQREGWDGLYNNEMLPSSDYWFVVSLTDKKGETKVHRGHFSLIRR